MSEAKKYGNCDRHVKYNRSCMDCSAPAEAKPATLHRRIWFGDACDEWALSPGNGWEEYMSLQESQERERLLTEALEEIRHTYYVASVGYGHELKKMRRLNPTRSWQVIAEETLAKIRGTNG